MNKTDTRVLIAGYRAGLRAALEQMGVPFAIWSDVPVKRALPGVRILVQPFGATRKTCRRHVPELIGDGPFTHVIAGTEAGVVAASHMRHELGARRSAHTIAHRCHDKLHMKRALHRHGIPMTDFLDGNEPRSASALSETLGLPVVVKDRKSSGGRGLEILRDLPDETPLRWPNRILEAFVDAEEISVESFINHGEILFENITQYTTKRHVNVVPAALAPALRDKVLDLNRRAIEALQIEWGMTHLEVFTTGQGPLFGEIALRPPGGYIMDAMRLAYGFDPWSAFASIELDRPFPFPPAAGSVAASVIIHPGPGTVKAIEGWDEVRKDPHVRSARLRLEVGDCIHQREGLRDVGRVLLQAGSHGALQASLDRIASVVRIDMSESG